VTEKIRRLLAAAHQLVIGLQKYALLKACNKSAGKAHVTHSTYVADNNTNVAKAVFSDFSGEKLMDKLRLLTFFCKIAMSGKWGLSNNSAITFAANLQKCITASASSTKKYRIENL
jgi:hypothetical protein